MFLMFECQTVGCSMFVECICMSWAGFEGSSSAWQCQLSTYYCSDHLRVRFTVVWSCRT